MRVERGDYVESQLAERMDTGQAGRRHRRALAPARRAPQDGGLRDAASRTRSTSATSSAAPACWPSTSTATTPTDERDAILARLSRGEIDVVCNCMVLTEGWDQPDVSCIVLARPTKHMGLYRQMIGRVLRPAPGKDHALVLDHAGAIFSTASSRSR